MLHARQRTQKLTHICVGKRNEEMVKDWARNKPLIMALYLDHRLTLNETKKIMEEQHNFVAS